MFNPLEKAQAYAGGITKPDAYTPYALGAKTYGSGRPMPHIGAQSWQSMQGYQARDRQIAARKQAVLQYMQAQNMGPYGAGLPGYLRAQG